MCTKNTNPLKLELIKTIYIYTLISFFSSAKSLVKKKNKGRNAHVQEEEEASNLPLMPPGASLHVRTHILMTQKML